VWSHRYQAEVLAQPAVNGEFRHIGWDGWGFPGAGNTVEYLVLDPEDSLAGVAKNHQSGKLDGIPCAVPPVHRRNNHWYVVLYYTGEDWVRGNSGDPVGDSYRRIAISLTTAESLGHVASLSATGKLGRSGQA